MRLWSIHPKYLDRKGLLAAWREALLAKKVLEGKTEGYRNHPQLERFRKSPDPLKAINTYLFFLCKEARLRCYEFNESCISSVLTRERIPVRRGQIEFEFEHLMNKLEKRDQKKMEENKKVEYPDPHPMFRIVPGNIESWERF